MVILVLENELNNNIEVNMTAPVNRAAPANVWSSMQAACLHKVRLVCSQLANPTLTAEQREKLVKMVKNELAKGQGFLVQKQLGVVQQSMQSIKI